MPFARHKCEYRGFHRTTAMLHGRNNRFFFPTGKSVLSNAKCFHCSSTVHYLFFSTSNMSNVEYYNTWYGRKATFNLMFYQYLNNKFIDSHGHKFKTEILPNCFDKNLFNNSTSKFQSESMDSLPMFIIFFTLCLSDIILMLLKETGQLLVSFGNIILCYLLTQLNF